MDYELKALGKICSKTGKPFGPGDVCYSTVIEKGNEWVRLDFSAGAWTGPPEGALGFWRVTVPVRDQPKRRVLDPDALLRHFEQLCEDANPAREKFCRLFLEYWGSSEVPQTDDCGNQLITNSEGKLGERFSQP